MHFYMIYSSIKFCEKQGQFACIMSKAIKAKKKKCWESNTVSEIWKRKE